MTGVVQLFAAYPLRAVEAILSPLSGLPAKHTFMPSIAEIKAALHEEMASYWRSQSRASVFDRSRMLPAPEEAPRPTLDELRAKHGGDWGLHPQPAGKPKASWFRPLSELLIEAGVSRETFDQQQIEAREAEQATKP